MRSPSVFAMVMTFFCWSCSGADAATRSWPGVAPCADTLQACISASAAGDTVQIVTNTAIAESLGLPRSITLEGGVGYSVRLAAGFGIVGSSVGSANYNVVVRRMALTDARIELTHGSSGTASIEVRRVDIASTTPGSGAGIRIHAIDGGTATVRIADNRLQLAVGPLGMGILVEFAGTDGSALVDFNHISNSADGGWGIYSETDQQSTETVSIVNNEIRGRYGLAAIGVSEGRVSTATNTLTARVIGNAVIGHNRLGIGVMHFSGNGVINTKTANNSSVDLDFGFGFQRWTPTGGGSISGTLINNLVAHNRVGLNVTLPFQAGLNESNNLLFDNLANVYTPSASDLTVDPLLHSLTDVRLRVGSPAINAANSLGTLDAYVDAGIGLVDADGLRRFKATQADIGAYEFGDFSLRVRADAPSGNYFVISPVRIDGFNATDLNARLFPTVYSGASGGSPFITNTQPIGVWYLNTAGNENWRIFNQVPPGAAMPIGVRFNVFAPSDGGGTFVHTATAGNLSGHLTTLNNGALNNLAERIVLASANWNPGGTPAGIYNPHTYSVGYFPPSWFVLNNDFGAISVGAAFNIYSQDPSPNAFVHTASTANILGATTILDHPLLNGIPCAQVYLTPRSGVHGDTTFDVYYEFDIARWVIFNHGVAMANGAEFNVVIDAAQVAACHTVMFADGFES